VITLNNKGTVYTDIGKIFIEKEVISLYAGNACMTTMGVVGMAGINVKTGLYSLLKKEYLAKGVDTEIINNKIKINLHIIVASEVKIELVSKNVIDVVKYELETFTGLEVDEINVFVEGVKF
jgi:uncharacterized alkaline shock family protein YloU